jgi:hypothetical protein
MHVAFEFVIRNTVQDFISDTQTYTGRLYQRESKKHAFFLGYGQIPRWCFHLIVVRGFEYARDPESYASGSVATGRASLAGQVKG